LIFVVIKVGQPSGHRWWPDLVRRCQRGEHPIFFDVVPDGYRTISPTN
jgi:hypothetical protein